MSPSRSPEPPSRPPTAGARAFLAAMERRWACKLFDGEALDPGTVEYLLEIGRLSPSSFGLEHCRFVALSAEGPAGKAVLAGLRAACFDQDAVGSAGLAVAALVRRAEAYHPDSDFVRERSGRFPGGHPVFRADYEGYWRFLDGQGRVEDWARAQAYIALGNMMTGAAAADLDSCAIEGYDEAGVLGLLGEDPGTWRVALIAVFGRAAEPRRERFREPLAAVAELRP